MTRIEINIAQGTLHAKGHAGYARRGNDVVCAAVSVVTQLCRICADKHGGKCTQRDGEILIECTDKGFLPVLEACTDALKSIAVQHPLHVCVKVRR